MLHRSAPAAAMLTSFMIALSLTACTATPTLAPAPTPSPMPTGFASEREAFAAAESTYRAYVDAVNAQRISAGSRPEPTDFLTDDAHNYELEVAQYLEEQGWRIKGPSEITAVTYRRVVGDIATITVCLDASATRLLDANELDVTPTTRYELIGIEVDVRLRPAPPRIINSATSSQPC